jgi:hypothetical protein
MLRLSLGHARSSQLFCFVKILNSICQRSAHREAARSQIFSVHWDDGPDLPQNTSSSRSHPLESPDFTVLGSGTPIA